MPLEDPGGGLQQQLMLEIVEVIRRSDQGVTKPFICRGEDDQIYFVKGIGAGRRGQICEWIAGCLGRVLGLPIPPFEIVTIPDEFIRFQGGVDLSALGRGPAFGSRRRTLMELTHAAVPDVPVALQWDVLTFDWWIRNGDRMLTDKGGNPNLFWNPAPGELIVLDHNQAFDPDFSDGDFRDLHTFSGAFGGLFGDLVRQDEYRKRLEEALKMWPSICDTLPAEWMYTDTELTVPTDFDLDEAHTLLLRCRDDDFWSVR